MFAYSPKPMRRWAALAFAALLLAFAAFLLAFSVLFLDARVMAAGGLHAQAAESTYYVDCRAPAGGDGSRTEPWNTLTTVNAHTFVPGDRILFRRNTGCRGSLAPKGSGAEGSPIVVDAYGTGAKPL